MRIMGWIVGWKFRLSAAKSFEMWWPGTELNVSGAREMCKLQITRRTQRTARTRKTAFVCDLCAFFYEVRALHHCGKATHILATNSEV